MKQFEVADYVTAEGDDPFQGWLLKLDGRVRMRVQARILRFEEGNLGQRRHLGAGLYEAKLDFGPGYRLYFGLIENRLVLLLCGGSKTGQQRDIARARGYWEDYRNGE